MTLSTRYGSALAYDPKLHFNLCKICTRQPTHVDGYSSIIYIPGMSSCFEAAFASDRNILFSLCQIHTSLNRHIYVDDDASTRYVPGTYVVIFGWLLLCISRFKTQSRSFQGCLPPFVKSMVRCVLCSVCREMRNVDTSPVNCGKWSKGGIPPPRRIQQKRGGDKVSSA